MPWVYVPKSWNNIHAMSDFRLKVFCCVARNLSYTKAAQELFISQPAVTKHVKELENHYQTRLFERLGSRIELTHAGRLLLDHCEAILEAYNRLEFEMNLLRNEYSGELRLGASTTIAQYVLPPLLAQFIEKFPHITVSMFNGNSREVEVALQEHRIDLALLEGSSRLPSLKYAYFLDDELVMVMRTKSRLAVAEEISLDELQRLPLVLREIGSGTLDVIEKALAAHNIRLSALNVLLYLGGTDLGVILGIERACLPVGNVQHIHSHGSGNGAAESSFGSRLGGAEKCGVGAGGSERKTFAALNLHSENLGCILEACDSFELALHLGESLLLELLGIEPLLNH